MWMRCGPSLLVVGVVGLVGGVAGMDEGNTSLLADMEERPAYSTIPSRFYSNQRYMVDSVVEY